MNETEYILIYKATNYPQERSYWQIRKEIIRQTDKIRQTNKVTERLTEREKKSANVTV